MRKVAAFLALLGLAACAMPGQPSIDVSKLTPKETLYGIEMTYTVAANAAMQFIAQTPVSADTKAQILDAYTKAGSALDAADAAVKASGGQSTPGVISAISAAQSALSSLQAVLLANGVKNNG